MPKLLLIGPKQSRPRPWPADITAAADITTITTKRRLKVALRLKAAQLQLKVVQLQLPQQPRNVG